MTFVCTVMGRSAPPPPPPPSSPLSSPWKASISDKYVLMDLLLDPCTMREEPPEDWATESKNARGTWQKIMLFVSYFFKAKNLARISTG